MMSNQKFRIIKNELLAFHTTFRIGGKARYFFVAKTSQDLIQALLWARKSKLPYLILGGGSNVLISDKGFSGLVIKMQNTKCKVQENKIIAEAGVLLSRLVDLAQQHSLSGLEYFVNIPGTLGGAIYGNAGWPAGRKNIGDLVENIELLMPDNKIRKVSQEWMRFSYRSSRLKNFMVNKRPIILSATLKLKKDKKEKIQKRAKEILATRIKNIPHGYSAGCIFKNVKITQRFRIPPLFKNDQKLKVFLKKKMIPAGWLIEKCYLKGKKIGGAKISEGHANFIINFNQAKARDVLGLINLAKQKVKEKFKINLEEEIQII